MTRVEEKVRRGFDLIRRAGEDSDLLGAALLAFHSALSDYLDAELRRSSLLSDVERRAIDEGTMTWSMRATLAQRARLLTEKQRDRVLEINRVRTGFAHGEGFTGSARSVAAYGEFVAGLCGLAPLDATRDTAAYRAPTGAHRATTDSTATTATQPSATTTSRLRARAEERKARRTALIPESASFRVALAAVAMLLLITLAVVGLQQLMPSPPSIAGAPPTTFSATIAPSASTPTPQQARIVNLPPGAPGWLRTTPSFRAPTQPIPLSEGLEVTLLERDPVDAEGTRWRFVSVGGYDGWCPEHNLAMGNE